MTEVAYIMQGHSQFEDRLWGLAAVLSPDYPDPDTPYSGLDYFDLLPEFVWAGASVEIDRRCPGLPQYVLTVPDGLEDAFYATLEKLADQR